MGSLHLDPKATSTPRVGFHADLTAHALNTLLDQSKSDARAGVALLTMQTVEDLKDALLVRGIDPDAIVFDPQAQTGRISSLSTHTHHGLYALTHELHRIRQKVRHNLNEGLVVTEYGQLRVDLKLERGGLLLENVLEVRDPLLHRRTQFHTFRGKLHAGEATEFENVRDHAVHVER